MKSDVEHYPDPWWARHPVISVIGVVLICVVLSWAGYAFKVAMSPLKGEGDTILKNESVQNRTQAQERFRSLYAAVVTNQQNVVLAQAAAARNPKDRILGDNALGVQQICVTSVNDYNAETGKVLSAKWLPEDLPVTIDPSACDGTTGGAR